MQLTATGTYSDLSARNLTQQVTWLSANPAVATVSAAGLVAAQGAGTTSISASLSGVSGSTALTVSAATLSSIQLVPSAPSLAVGTTKAVRAYGLFSDGTTQEITDQATWTSSNGSIASVSTTAPAGLVHGLAVGSSTIQASMSGRSASTTATVTGATLASIQVTPGSGSVAAGLGLQLSATGVFSDGTTQVITGQVAWASSNQAVATVSNAAGSHGLAAGVAPGTATISAALNGVSGSASLSVTSATLTSIQVSPANPTVAVGVDRQLSATGVFSDGTTQVITGQVAWASSDQAVATVSNAAGSHGLAAGVAPGTATISAALNGVSGSASLSVTSATLTSIQVSPASSALPAGAMVRLTATAVFSDGSFQNVTNQAVWTSSTGAATVAPDGRATGVAPGSATLSAALNGVTGSAVLAVTSATLSALQLSPAAPTLAPGTSRQVMAVGIYSDNTVENLTEQVSWTSSSTSVATVSVSSVSGKATAAALSSGTTTLSASLGGISASTTLTVSNATLVSIAISPGGPGLAAGYSLQLSATGTFSDGSTQSLTSDADWISSDPSVVVVSNVSGSQGIAKGLAPGQATVSASLAGVTGAATVSVSSATLSSLAITPGAPTLPAGFAEHFVATGTFSDGSTQVLTNSATWTSSDTSVAAVYNATGVHGVADTLSPGSATITASLNGVSAAAQLTASPATLVSIAVTPAGSTVAVGSTLQLRATGTFSDGSTRRITSDVTWSSSDPSGAPVSNGLKRGAVTGVSPTTANITAVLGGVSGQTQVTVQ